MSRRSAAAEPREEPAITEIVQADIERVDGVLGPANGTPPLMMKSLDGPPEVDVERVLKAALHDPFTGSHTHPHPAMDAQGEDDTHEHEHGHDGDADHGHAHPVEKAEMVDCPTCDGKGKIMGGQRDCPDCEDGKVSADKAASLKKAASKYDAAELKAMAGKGHAMKNPGGAPSYPIGDEEDLDNAIHAVGRGGADHDAIRQHVIAGAKRLGQSDKIPENWGADGSLKKAVDDEAPGSPAWEAQDAASLRTVAAQLAALKDRLEGAADRERAEVDAGADLDDMEDAWDLDDACCALDAALGIVARLAFTEQQEALSPDGVAKAGRRLSSKSMGAIMAARDRLTELLGESAGPDPDAVDEPLPVAAGGSDVTADDLNKALDERLLPIQESLVQLAKALPGVPDSGGATVESATSEADAEEARQDRGGKPGMENPPSAPVEPPDAGRELPDMERAKSAATASGANPRYAKSAAETDTNGTDLEAFVKSLEGSLAKSIEGAVKPLADGMAELRKRVDDIANQPMPGGPLLNGADRRDHYLVVRPPVQAASPNVPMGDDAAVRKALDSMSPQDRDIVSRALALNASPFAPRQQ